MKPTITRTYIYHEGHDVHDEPYDEVDVDHDDLYDELDVDHHEEHDEHYDVLRDGHVSS